MLRVWRNKDLYMVYLWHVWAVISECSKRFVHARRVFRTSGAYYKCACRRECMGAYTSSWGREIFFFAHWRVHVHIYSQYIDYTYVPRDRLFTRRSSKYAINSIADRRCTAYCITLFIQCAISLDIQHWQTYRQSLTHIHTDTYRHT